MNQTQGGSGSLEELLAAAASAVPVPRTGIAASRMRLSLRTNDPVSWPGASPGPAGSAGASRGGGGSLTRGSPTGGAPERAVAPVRAGTPLDAEDADRELEALSTAIVLAPDAGAHLAVFAENAAAYPEGALVFACVLHLAGDGEGATFWWRLAAGAELHRAVSCLILDHTRRGEFEDADVWAGRLPEGPPCPDPDWHDRPCLTAEARQALARARHRVRRTTHEDLGEVPTADTSLAKAVFTLAVRADRPVRADWILAAPRTAAPPPRTARSVPGGPGTTRQPGGTTQARAGSRAGAEGRAGAPGGPEAPPPDGGGSAVYAAAPLRHTSLTALARRVPRASPAPDRWAEALRVLDVLDAVLRARRPLGTGEIAVAARLHPSPLALLLDWLCGHLLLVRLPDGAFTAGPLFRPDTGGDPVLRRGALRQVLDELRESTGAAVYVSRYAAGEVEIQHCADGPDTPAVHQWVDFREAAHASAVGKCLMAQLDFGARMDHLARHRPVRLTDRTITDPAALFRTLDGHGPHAGQFDLLEYSRHEVCAAVPLTVAGRPACVALSLPVIRGHRLTRAARTLSDRSGLLLLTLIAALPVDGDPARWNPRPGPRGRAADPTGPSPGTAYTAFSPSVGSGWTAAASGLAHPASLLAPLPEHGPAEARRPR